MTTDKTPIPGPEPISCDIADLAAPAELKTVADYSDAELLEGLDDACQHISGKAWLVTALATEAIRRANERNGDAA